MRGGQGRGAMSDDTEKKGGGKDRASHGMGKDKGAAGASAADDDDAQDDEADTKD
jgi:hypothetical protein